MKITDISTSTSTTVPEQAQQEQSTEQYERTKKRSLLDRLNIPIDHLDFTYVKNCTDAREVEKILRILRSGEEGTYLELEQCVEARLEILNPNSRSLRVETPAVRTRELLRDEREALENGLEEWLNDVSKLNKEALSSRNGKSSEIFNEGTDETVTECPLPVRGSAAAATYKVGTEEISSKNVKSSKTSKKSGESRIKSWEYEKWDKFDTDAELTKLDIVDMQREEWEKREKPKILEEQRKVEKLMKSSEDTNADKKFTGKPTKSTSSSPAPTYKAPKVESSHKQQQSEKKKVKPRMPIETKSFIEEINEDDDDDEAGESVNTSSVLKSYGSRKTTVVIEDLNLATK